MESFQKIEFALILLILIFNVLFFLSYNGFQLTGFSIYKEKLNAPSDFIHEEDIIVGSDNITINLSDYVISRYDSSKSMVPVLDRGANGIGIRPNSPDDVHVGDIISFFDGDNLIVHRVIEKGIDEQGVFFITKGDNNDFNDGRVRFSQIDSVLVILIY